MWQNYSFIFKHLELNIALLCATSLIQSTVTVEMESRCRWMAEVLCRCGGGEGVGDVVVSDVEEVSPIRSFLTSRSSFTPDTSRGTAQDTGTSPNPPPSIVPVHEGRQRKCIFIRPCLRLAQSCLSHCTVECRLNQPTNDPTNHHAPAPRIEIPIERLWIFITT